MLKIKEEVYQNISKNDGKAVEKVKLDSESDYWNIDDEAKAYGMIDEVLRR